MNYVIFDLEWNNVYSRKQNGFINEIIEIGAVMLDSSLEIIDTFTILVKSQLCKKLNGRVKRLTHISNEDLKSGVSFSKAIKEFKKWLSDRDCVFLSWGNSDIRTLVDNLLIFLEIKRIPFIEKYMDLQKYCQTVMNINEANQIGLSASALQLGIDISEFSAHRALEDCLISSRCFKKCFERTIVPEFIMDCNDDFYRRLEFKVHNITNINNPKIDRSKMLCVCEKCNDNALQLSDWKNVNQVFRALFFCKNCETNIICFMKYKETYDSVNITTTQKKVDINDI